MANPEKSTLLDPATKENPPLAPPMSVVSAKGGAGHITVVVGPEAREYVIHKALLTHYSEYFSIALNGPWKEAEDGTITLEDIELGTFNVFVDWLYTQKLPATEGEWDVVAEAEYMRNLSTLQTRSERSVASRSKLEKSS